MAGRFVGFGKKLFDLAKVLLISSDFVLLTFGSTLFIVFETFDPP